MKNKQKKKYAYGGTALNLDSPSQGLSKIRKTTEDALYGSMMDPTVLGLKGLGSMMTSTGMAMAGKGFSQAGDMSGMGGFLQDNMSEISKLIGSANMATMMATGGTVGKVPINAEGGEVIDTPFGLPIELFGPSHAKGGIDLNVPEGTDIYSKRLKGPDGKSMADRKKSREKKAADLAKVIEDNPSDKLAKATLEKIQSNNEIIDTTDVAKMDMVRSIGNNKFATGGTVGTGPGPMYNTPAWLQNLILSGTSPEFGNAGNASNIDEVIVQAPTKKFMDTNLNGPILNTGTIQAPQINPINYGASGLQQTRTTGSGITGNMDLSIGDAIGMAGNLVSTFGPMQNTIRNRQGDTPNINAFSNYGQAGLNKLEQSEQYINQVRDNKLQDLELSRQGTINRNNNSARGINTLRALNLATDSMANNSRDEIYNQFAQSMQGIMSQEASMLNDRDSKVMQGEYMRDLADRQDRDNFFSQLGKDISTMGTGLQVAGKNVNAMKTRGVTEGLLNQMYNQFGIDAMTGEVKAKATQEISNNPSFYSYASKDALNGILKGTYVRKGDSLYDRKGNQLDPATLQIITPASTTPEDKYKLSVKPEDIYDIYSPFKTGQA